MKRINFTLLLELQVISVADEQIDGAKITNTTTVVYNGETECKYSFEECPSCQQIKCVLAEYQKIISGDKDFVGDSVFTDEYTVVDLLNDFHHLREAHSIDDDENPQRFEMYHDFVTNVEPSVHCQSANCQVLRRHYRRRRGNELLTASLDSTQGVADYCEAILLQIHCYLIHSMDISKLTRSERILVESQSDPDQKQSKMNEFMKEKSQRIMEMVGDTTNDKFVSNVDNEEVKDEDNDDVKLQSVPMTPSAAPIVNEHSQRQEYEYFDRDDAQILGQFQQIAGCTEEVAVAYLRDSEWNPAIALHRFYNEQNEIEINVGNNVDLNQNNNDIYTEGVRFWYWSAESRPSNALMVHPKHSNLKEEIITAGHLSIGMWNNLVKLCETQLRVRWVQKIKSSGNGHRIYGVKAGIAFALQWLLSLKLYTDFDKLNHEFCDQFRFKKFAGNVQETVSSIRKRNGRYFNMAKQLTECVQCFGAMLVPKKKRYYRGSNRSFVFSRFVARFHVPLSTSKSVCAVSMLRLVVYFHCCALMLVLHPTVT